MQRALQLERGLGPTNQVEVSGKVCLTAAWLRLGSEGCSLRPFRGWAQAVKSSAATFRLAIDQEAGQATRVRTHFGRQRRTVAARQVADRNRSPQRV